MDAVVARGINRRIVFTVTPALRVRFWKNVRKAGPDDCWPWIGAPRNGYGAIKHEKKVLSAHVVSFVLTFGEIPEGKLVLHTCDNRICCNPKHLEAGTPKKNVDDMRARRAMNTPRGEGSYNAILNEEQVMLVRALNVRFGYGAKRIGEMLDINPGTLKNVLSGATWKHIAWPSADDAALLVSQKDFSSC